MVAKPVGSIKFIAIGEAMEVTYIWDTKCVKRFLGVLYGELGIWSDASDVVPVEKAKNITKLKYKGLNVYFQHIDNKIRVVVVNKQAKAKEFGYDKAWYEWCRHDSENMPLWHRLRVIPKDLKEIFSMVML